MPLPDFIASALISSCAMGGQAVKRFFMLSMAHASLFILLTFLIGYTAIALEYNIKVNKTASALLMAVLAWLFFFLVEGRNAAEDLAFFGKKFNEVSQIIFFLLGSMTIVELIDSHKGFKIVTDVIRTHRKKKILWTVGLITFFLSAVLDNLTTTIVMVSLLRKLISESHERMILSAIVVIAANLGGAWTPIGDVTTTMLWINGNITSLHVMAALFLPTFLALIAALWLAGIGLKGSYAHSEQTHAETLEPAAKLIFCCGLGALIFVPIFKGLTGLPPFMGVLIGLGFLWLVTDILHGKEETRKHLRVPHTLTRVDTSGVLFFLGVLLCINALDAAGLLRSLAAFLDRHLQSLALTTTLIGLISAIVDNVPLVAAGMGMYDLQVHPVDSPLWTLLAYCAGTGGSILIIGSAAGIALMGMEKINFFWYLRQVSWIALFSYFVGIGVYLLQSFVLTL